MLEKIAGPLWQTPVAVMEVLAQANMGTTAIGLFLFIAALELLRSSAGVLEMVARTAALGAALFVGASMLYGDFMAPAAKAAYARIASRPPESHTTMALAATFGAATTAVAFGTARAKRADSARRPSGQTQQSGPRLSLALLLSAADPARIAALSKLGALDVASRIQLRLVTNRPAKAEPRKVPRARGKPRSGAPAFWRMTRA